MQNLYRLNLGRYRFNRRDILVIEKILRIYADAYEKRSAAIYAQRSKPPDGQRCMPRKYADLHVDFNGVRADNVKFFL